MRNNKRKLLIAGMLILVLFLLSGCGTAETASYTSLSDFENKRIGVTTGSIQVQQAEERFPDAEILYFATSVDMLNAMKASRIDGYADAEILVRYMMGEDPELTYIEEKLADDMKIAAIFPKTEKGQRLCDEYNAFVREIRASGEYDEILDIWLGSDESRKTVPDPAGLAGTNGRLRVAVDVTLLPFAYIKDGEPVGIDIDTAVRFCRKYGYALELVSMDFGAILPAITTGKCDLAAGGVAYTAERAESVLFSEPTYEGGSVIAVLNADAGAGAGFWESIRISFEKTFLRESRWKLFLKGIGNTLLITLLSALFGTLLGFFAYLLCRKGNSIANKVTGACIWLVQGMPTVVLLMVLYYVVFSRLDFSALTVAVIGFSLTFGASMFGMLRGGVKAVDRGQTEAAYALGYKDRTAFFRIILPQAAFHFLPDYRGQIIALLKATAIVGYITVLDLTKMGDIVRSRTYEAFFPLLAVTFFYFVIAAVLGRIIKGITFYADPHNRKPEKILKGVRTHD